MWDYVELIIYSNSLPFVGLIFFIFFILHNPVFDKRQSKFFLITAIITLIMIVAISFDFMFARSEYLNDQLSYVYLLRRITSFMNFAASPLIPMFIYNIYKAKEINRLFYLPSIINIIVCFLSIPTGIVFEITVGNHYDRGVLFLLPFLTTVCYMAMLIIQPGHSFTKSKRAERWFLFSVVGVLACCMYFEIIQHFLFLTWTFTSVCLIMYYLLLNIHRTIMDPLTGAYNRLAYLKACSTIETRKTCMFALLDINDFKDVNDQFGHDVGDRFLMDFTYVLETTFSSIGDVYRIGGDEFVIIIKKVSEPKFLDALQKAQHMAKAKGIQFACGWMIYTPDMEMTTLQVEIDQRMYEQKKHKTQNQKQIVQ